MIARALLLGLTAVSLLLSIGCTTETTQSPPSPFAACPPRAGAVDSSGVPDVPVKCFGSDQSMALNQVWGKPTVINLWASWCAPCRAELPVLQRLADSGKVQTLGVISRDTRAAASGLAEDLKIRFPQWYDQDGAFGKRLGGQALPVTLFINPQGHLVHTYRAGALTDASLSTLVREHLGVT